jgi:hypothetical protein
VLTADASLSCLLFHSIAKALGEGPQPSRSIFLTSLSAQDEGGIFTDLSWIHLRPISLDISTGYHQATICSTTESDIILEPLLSLSEPNFNAISQQTFQFCYTSSLMILRRPSQGAETGTTTETPASHEPHQRILKCMLSKYEDDEHGPLRKCLDLEPPLTGGALCVQVTPSLSVSLSHSLLTSPYLSNLSPIIARERC